MFIACLLCNLSGKFAAMKQSVFWGNLAEGLVFNGIQGYLVPWAFVPRLSIRGYKAIRVVSTVLGYRAVLARSLGSGAPGLGSQADPHQCNNTLLSRRLGSAPGLAPSNPRMRLSKHMSACAQAAILCLFLVVRSKLGYCACTHSFSVANHRILSVPVWNSDRMHATRARKIIHRTSCVHGMPSSMFSCQCLFVDVSFVRCVWFRRSFVLPILILSCAVCLCLIGLAQFHSLSVFPLCFSPFLFFLCRCLRFQLKSAARR